MESRNAADRRFDMLGGDGPRALELTWRARVAGAPQEIVVIEAALRVVPAAIAGVVVDHPIGRGELVRRVGEATDHDHRCSHRPGEPGEPARQTDEEIGVAKPARPFRERPVAGLVLDTVRDLVPHDARAMKRLLVDADDAVAALFEELDNLEPAPRVVPIFRLRRALRSDADIRLSDRTAVVLKNYAGWQFLRVDAENVASGPMQPDQAEVARLPNAVGIIEEQADAIGRIEFCRVHLLVRDKRDVRVSVPEQRDQQLGHRAGQAASVLLLETHSIGKPADQIAKGPDWELDQHFAVSRVVVVTEDAGPVLPRLDAKPDKIALRAVYVDSALVSLEKDISRI